MGSRGGHRQNALMPRSRTVTKDESPSLEELLASQRKALEHLQSWMRHKGIRQKDIANALGTSEGQISKYIGGKIQMTVAVLRQIAAVLKTHPGDLFKAPPEEGLGERVEETLALMDDLSPDEWATVLGTARAIRAAKKGS